MKISLAWIADHIKIPRTELNNERIVELLNAKTAEIDAVETIKTELSSFFVVTITDIQEAEISADCPERKNKVRLPLRKDVLQGQQYLC